MSRLRLFRIAIPIALLVFVAAIGLALKSRPQRGAYHADSSPDSGTRMEGFRFSDFVQGRRRLLVQAKVGRVDEQGAFDVEEVQRLEVDREGHSPLLLTASRGTGSGVQGKRIVRLDGGVTLHDDEHGLDIAIPTVEIDQVAGVVRSLGEVTLKNEAWTGGAAAVVYSLKGDPTEVTDLSLTGPLGGHLTARHAVIPAGSRTLTLSGEVDAAQGGMSVRAEEVVVERRADGGIESATASPAVTGSASGLGGGLASFTAREARARWDEQGKVTAVSLSGGARIKHTRGSIAADRVAADAVEPPGTISLVAAGQVVASGPTQHGTGTLSAESLSARLDPKGVLRDGVAAGDVRFQGEGTTGEAAEARATSLDSRGTVTLTASATRRARLANGRIRIVAESIVSDARGEKLVAEGRVESTLLPAAGTAPTKSSAMFATTEAVHFVSASLDSEHAGARLLFRGDVRGWQGDRTLSADEVELIQEGEVLNATGHVATRIPRQAATPAATEADFVMIGSERLAYRGKAHNATYEGNVRVRQAEGWLQAPRLVATLAESGPGMREVQALDGVRFEYRTPGDRGVPTTATGDGDRAIYDTVARILRVFGDTGPATVRSTGPKGGITVGRVLRYEVDSGALEVESGERDRATIQTPKD